MFWLFPPKPIQAFSFSFLPFKTRWKGATEEKRNGKQEVMALLLPIRRHSGKWGKSNSNSNSNTDPRQHKHGQWSNERKHK